MSIKREFLLANWHDAGRMRCVIQGYRSSTTYPSDVQLSQILPSYTSQAIQAKLYKPSYVACSRRYSVAHGMIARYL